MVLFGNWRVSCAVTRYFTISMVISSSSASKMRMRSKKPAKVRSRRSLYCGMSGVTAGFSMLGWKETRNFFSSLLYTQVYAACMCVPQRGQVCKNIEPLSSFSRSSGCVCALMTLYCSMSKAVLHLGQVICVVFGVDMRQSLLYRKNKLVLVYHKISCVG